MFAEALLFAAAGILLGVITGLIPGLHPNTVFVILLSFPLLYQINYIYALVFIVSLSVTNTFTDFIPSILLGAPEPSTELSVLPGHSMLLSGRGYEALFLTVLGGVGVTALAASMLPILFYIIPLLYSLVAPYMPAILSIIAVWMVLSSRRKPAAALSFLLSGLLGVVSLSSLPSNASLFPALTGLFGISGLIIGAGRSAALPKQNTEAGEMQTYKKAVLVGWFSGLFSGLLPGIGSSQAGVISARLFGSSRKEFLVSLGGINTSNIFFTLVALYAIGKTRSGAAAALSQIIERATAGEIFLIVSSALLSCFVSALLTLKTGKTLIKRAENANYRKLSLFVVAFLVFMVLFFSGAAGILVMLVATTIGIFTILSGARRVSMMGYFMLPTILYFTGGFLML